LKKEEMKMKSTGVVRKVDELGRIVLPIEIRKVLDINQKDAIEIFTDEDKIILQKYQPACVFCNNVTDVIYFNGKRICKECIAKLKEQM
jgi:transcriptional pleiotropic regulator of transition state genes